MVWDERHCFLVGLEGLGPVFPGNFQAGWAPSNPESTYVAFPTYSDVSLEILGVSLVSGESLGFPAYADPLPWASRKGRFEPGRAAAGQGAPACLGVSR